jgi:hypothetical protein
MRIGAAYTTWKYLIGVPKMNLFMGREGIIANKQRTSHPSNIKT